VARLNAETLGLAAHVSVRHGSLFDPVQGETFDSIVFNMPLMHSEHDGTPHLALDDPRGAVARSFLDHVAQHLKPGGCVYMTFSNLSEPALLQSFVDRGKLSLLVAEWVVETGFWLMMYKFEPGTAGVR